MAGSHSSDHVLERLVFFSDAVFAIAITLLVIDIRIPDLPSGSSDTAYLEALSELVPSFAGYFISFAIVAAFWVCHHRAFALAARYSPRVLPWNLGLLGLIAFVPFASAFASHNISDRIPILFYCAVIAACGILNFCTVCICTSEPMVRPRVPSTDKAAIRARAAGLVLGALTALAIGWLDPRFGLFGLASVGPWVRIVRWTARSRATAK